MAVLVGGIAFGFYRASTPGNATAKSMAISATSVTIGATTVAVEVANTDAARSLGLSGRTSLAEGSGMLFIFDTPGNYGFWMKDMNFPIDILFIDASGGIVSIAADASPAGYHQDPPQVFYPAAPAKYVLEVPAGFAARHGIKAGQTAAFK